MTSWSNSVNILHMPRKARKYRISDSTFYHIVNRGALRQTIFHDDLDRQKFLSLLKQYQDRENVKTYHWCLMGNHYHLVLSQANPERIGKLIGGIQQLYAYYYHQRYHTAGRFFGSRFKSQVIQDEKYLLIWGRYVERNPARAGLVQNAWDWPWSSAAFYALGVKDGITANNPQWANHPGQDYQKWLGVANEEEELQLTGTNSKDEEEKEEW